MRGVKADRPNDRVRVCVYMSVQVCVEGRWGLS